MRLGTRLAGGAGWPGASWVQLKVSGFILRFRWFGFITSFKHGSNLHSEQSLERPSGGSAMWRVDLREGKMKLGGEDGPICGRQGDGKDGMALKDV